MPGRKDDDIDRKKYPNLAAQRDLDKAEHVKAAEKMGLTHKQANQHAEDDLHDD